MLPLQLDRNIRTLGSMNWLAFTETVVTLFVIVDPLGTVPTFVALTAGRTPVQRRWAAVQSAATAGALIAVFALFGRILLGYLNVSIQSLAIAGGLLLLLVALEMFRGHSGEASSNVNIVLVPLATPLLAGPGAIAAVMVLANRHTDLGGRVGVILGVVTVVVVVAVILLLAGQLARILRPAFVDFLTRVLALLLSAIAVQLVVDAVRALIDGGQ
jgi:multiple antibiotic resistance protein